MATKETVDLGPPHEPKEESIKAFKEIEHELKKQLVHLRHTLDKHEKEYFEAANHLTDRELASFTPDDFTEVRVAEPAYGVVLLGRLRIPALPEDGPAYVHFRAFSEGVGQPATFHSIRTEEKDAAAEGGGKTFRALFTKADPLEWFDA